MAWKEARSCSIPSTRGPNVTHCVPLPPRHLLQASSKASLRRLKTCSVRNVKQSATPCSSSGMVNSVLRRRDCGLDGACLKARAVPSEKYSCHADPPDQSAGVVHDEYTLPPDARSITWLERARATSDLACTLCTIQLASMLKPRLLLSWKVASTRMRQA